MGWRPLKGIITIPFVHIAGPILGVFCYSRGHHDDHDGLFCICPSVVVIFIYSCIHIFIYEYHIPNMKTIRSRYSGSEEGRKGWTLSSLSAIMYSAPYLGTKSKEYFVVSWIFGVEMKYLMVARASFLKAWCWLAEGALPKYQKKWGLIKRKQREAFLPVDGTKASKDERAGSNASMHHRDEFLGTDWDGLGTGREDREKAEKGRGSFFSLMALSGPWESNSTEYYGVGIDVLQILIFDICCNVSCGWYSTSPTRSWCSWMVRLSIQSTK